VSNTYQKNRRRAARPGLLPGEVTVPEQVIVSMAEIAESAKEGLLALAVGAGLQLTRQGHKVSADTVGELLREEGFSLEGNAKTVEGKRHPDRDAQFRRLLITADAGGSNGYRARAWKTGLAALAAETGLEITVCHFPPGTSKWNKIDHRLFSAITMNWRGRPLTSHEVIVNSIAATTTGTGLTSARRTRPGQRPNRNRDQQSAAGRGPAGPPPLSRRLELHHPPPPRPARARHRRRRARQGCRSSPRPRHAVASGADRHVPPAAGRPDR
jgi:hypothetical protein